MRTSLMFNVTLVTFWSVSMLYSAEIATARPTANQVEAWLKVGAAALGITGTVYGGYNTFLKDGEVQRNLTDNRGKVLFAYTSNCRDRTNVPRFWQHRNNGTAVSIVSRAFPNDVRSQKQAVLNLINRACGSF